MFFQELYGIAKHTALTLIIAPAGEQLKVIVQPKPGGKGDPDDVPALTKPFVAQGTPEELDRELPASIRAYAEKTNEVRLKIDAPIEALDQAAAKGKVKSAAAERRAQKKKEKEERKAANRKKHADARAAQKAKREAAAKAKADKRAAKKKVGLPGATKPAAKPAAKKPAPKPAPAPAKPTATAAAWPFPIGNKAPATAAAAETEDDVQHRTDLPGKAECIQDYQQLKLKHGEKLTRRKFINTASTGRRYEKLWANWAKFVKDAEAQGDLPLEPASAAVTAESLTDDTPPRKGEGKGTSTDVYDEAGNYLSSITTKPAIGEHIGLVSQDKLLRITAVERRQSGGLDVTVVPDPEYTREHSEKIAAQVREQAAAREKDKKPEAAPATGGLETRSGTIPVVAAPAPDPKPYKIFVDGKVVAESKYQYTLGEKLDVEGTAHRIYARNNNDYLAEPVPVWQVWNQADEVIGTIEHEPKVGDKIDVGEQKGLTVIDVEDRNCTAILVKPRARPAAAAAPATSTE